MSEPKIRNQYTAELVYKSSTHHTKHTQPMRTTNNTPVDQNSERNE